jgi:hypothetical protein
MRDKVVIPEEKHQRFMSKMAADQFFGIVETFFEGGRIVLVKKHETFVAPDVDRLIQTV